ncbi:hypothetical protein HZA55_09245 [Candidatus Poribacteria bacterium]|nr:hypothetical protein [Candidatus Poribacteria bacterium]
MQILGIEYAMHEVWDLIYFTILAMTLPIGVITQLYLAVKQRLAHEPAAVQTIDNKKSKKIKKVKSK